MSFCSAAGALDVAAEACDGCVLDAGPDEGRSDGKESTRPAADEAGLCLMIVGASAEAVSETTDSGSKCWKRSFEAEVA